MRLDVGSLATFQIGKVFPHAAVSSLCFDDSGELFVAGSTSNSELSMYSTSSGELKKSVLCKQHGCGVVRFAHQSSTVLVSSNNGGWDEAIRYLSFHDVRNLRLFKGHQARVASLDVHPTDDTFLSASVDGEVRTWDIRTNHCQGLLKLPGPAFAAFDPQGLLFAAVDGRGDLRLFDTRKMDAGPFDVFDTLQAQAREGLAQAPSFTSLTFSPTGKHILLATNQNKILLVDAFKGSVAQSYSGHIAGGNCVVEAAFSPDGAFVVSGSDDGNVLVWEAATGKLVHTLAGHPKGTMVPCVRWCPNRMMFATGGGNLALWQPTPKPTTTGNPFRNQGHKVRAPG